MGLEEFRRYWDEWHSVWKETMLDGNITEDTKINGWPLPKVKDKDKKNTYWNFPEPYWGGHSKELFGLFLSINPGKPQLHHLISKAAIDQNIYFPDNGVYSSIIRNISKEEKNKTIKWMKKRIVWLQQIVEEKKSEINLETVLLTDLVPWHTENKRMITTYLKEPEVRENLIKNVLVHIIEISKTVIGPMNNKIIVRGTSLLDLENDQGLFSTILTESQLKIDNHELFVVLDEKEQTFSKFMSLLTTFSISETTFYIFSGGSSMNLPDPGYMVYPVKKNNKKFNYSESISLRDFIRG
jgi:hypothetical protein